MTSSTAMTTSFALHSLDINSKRSSALASWIPITIGMMVRGSCDLFSASTAVSVHGYLTREDTLPPCFRASTISLRVRLGSLSCTAVVMRLVSAMPRSWRIESMTASYS